jgi:hypothetical protein
MNKKDIINFYSYYSIRLLNILIDKKIRFSYPFAKKLNIDLLGYSNKQRLHLNLILQS